MRVFQAHLDDNEINILLSARGVSRWSEPWSDDGQNPAFPAKAGFFFAGTSLFSKMDGGRS
jgi:hypothetical protein